MNEGLIHFNMYFIINYIFILLEAIFISIYLNLYHILNLRQILNLFNVFNGVIIDKQF